MVRRSFPAFAFLLLFSAAPMAPASPTLTLVWNDSYGLFPSNAVWMLGREVEQLFEDHGMAVRLQAAKPKENLRSIPDPRINVVVMPSDGSRWGLQGDAMAATIGVKGGAHNIFVFYPRVLLGLGRSGKELSPRDVSELARAMARVVGHEVIHVLAPELGHTGSGLMSAELKRRDLVQKTIRLDPPSLRLAKLHLESWAPAEPTAAALDAQENVEVEPCETEPPRSSSSPTATPLRPRI
jgi:hypothetical protein